MCSKVTLLPEQRAFDSMYEVCVRAGAYQEALDAFEEHEEMRLSLWKPRFTPVSFSLLLTAAAADSVRLSEMRNSDEIGDNQSERLDYLPRVLNQMGRHGVLPRAETCDNLLRACVKHGHLETARRVVEIAESAGHELDAAGVQAFEKAEAASLLHGDSSRKSESESPERSE